MIYVTQREGMTRRMRLRIKHRCEETQIESMKLRKKHLRDHSGNKKGDEIMFKLRSCTEN